MPASDLAEQVFAQDPVEEYFINRITEEKYSPADLDEVVAGCNDINQEQRQRLHQLLSKYD